MRIERAAVVGLGTMGAGIAEVLARAGLTVTCVEISEELLGAGRGRIESSLDRAVERGRLAADERSAIGSRLRFTVDLMSLSDVDLVVEAVHERLEAKTALFDRLAGVCPPAAIFATNTSSLPVTAIAVRSGRPDRVVGMHFFNPAPVMRLVEVVSTVLIDPDVVASIAELAVRAAKTPVVVGDRAGFIANTLLVGYLGHAARMIDAGVVSVADLDAAVVAACGLPMGPLRLLDLIGLDVTVEILGVLNDEFSSPRYAVAPLLRRLVLAGRLGVKSGEGFYKYAGRDATPAVSRGPLAGLPAATAAPGRIALVAADGGNADAVSAALGGAVEPTKSLVDKESSQIVIVALGDDPAALTEFEQRADHGAQTVVGVHLPRAPRPTPVVEIVIPNESSAAAHAIPAVETVRTLAAAAGRTVAVCKGRVGYAVESLIFAQLNDAAAMVGDGYATAVDVDAAMTLGCGYPAGPFAMLDEVGAAVVASAVADPSPLLVELAAAGPGPG